MSTPTKPDPRIRRGPRAFYFIEDNPKRGLPTGTWRRTTLKSSKDSTPRTIRRNLARLRLVQQEGLHQSLLGAPA